MEKIMQLIEIERQFVVGTSGRCGKYINVAQIEMIEDAEIVEEPECRSYITFKSGRVIKTTLTRSEIKARIANAEVI
jgi:hypothetical protein